MKKRTVLIVAHGHPEIAAGGGEYAAYNMHQEINKSQEFKSVFLGRKKKNEGASSPSIMALRENEFVMDSGSDFFFFRQEYKDVTLELFPSFLKLINPDIIHFHHFIHLGLELLCVAKKILPNVKIVLTLHEYLAICNNNGQLLKKESEKNCKYFSYESCHECFPNVSEYDFFLKKLRTFNYFNLVDLFISPSYFLKKMYEKWGLSADKIIVLENGQNPADPLPPRCLKRNEKRGSFGYFGQISHFKGVDLLLRAFLCIPKKHRYPSGGIKLSLYGGNLHFSTDSFIAVFNDCLEQLKDCVTFYGEYRQEDMPELMKDIDWVVMPSIWYENSPLVIQESYKFKRPIMVSSIGGMKEKVVDNVTGLYFTPNNPYALADKILSAAQDNSLWDKLYSNIKAPIEIETTTKLALQMYSNLITGIDLRSNEK